MDFAAHVGAGGGAKSRREVDQAHPFRADRAALCGGRVGRFDDERYTIEFFVGEAAFVEKAAVDANRFAVIGREDDERILVEPA